MAVTRAWKVYGMFDGEVQHRQRESFHPSFRWDFSKEDNVRIIEVENADKTGTNDYSLVRITRNTAEECERELEGQLSDGIFENSRWGKVEEAFEAKPFEAKAQEGIEKLIANAKKRTGGVPVRGQEKEVEMS